MTTTLAPRPTRTRTHNGRTTARVAGILYLVTFASSIPAVALLGPILHDQRYVLGAGDDTRVLLGCLLDMINAAACVGTAVSLYPVVKRQNAATALGFVTSRVMEAAIIMIGVVSLVAVVTLRQELAAAPAADPGSMLAAGRALVEVRNGTFLLGPSLLPAVNAVLLGSLMYRSRLVPRVIPAMGLIGAPLLLAATLATMFGAVERVSAWTGIATLPVAAWEFSLGAWLAVKGFRDIDGPARLDGPADRAE